MSPYAPAKIDLGGLLLGAIIGVGSILIIPKLLYILSGTYGTYARSKYIVHPYRLNALYHLFYFFYEFLIS